MLLLIGLGFLAFQQGKVHDFQTGPEYILMRFPVKIIFDSCKKFKKCKKLLCYSPPFFNLLLPI